MSKEKEIKNDSDLSYIDFIRELHEKCIEMQSTIALLELQLSNMGVTPVTQRGKAKKIPLIP